jgi:putative oligomerization/nucleic acid binding protein
MRTRRIAVGAILAVATVVFTLAIVATWANRQVVDTDNWTETSEEVLANDQVRESLGNFLVQQLFAAAPIEDSVRQALPPRLQPLAGPAVAGLREAAQRNTPRLLGTAAALNAWKSANRAAHKTLIKVLRSERVQNGEVTLDLGALATQIADSTGLPPSAVDKLPPDVTELTVLKSDQLEAAQNGFDLLENLPLILGLLTLILFGLAIWLSPDRRRTILSCGLVLIISAIAVLALRRLLGAIVVDALANAPNAQDAAPDVWNIVTSLMVDAAEGAMLGGFFIVLGAWFSGPGRRAVALRRWSAPSFRDQPALVHGGLAAALLLLIWWGPVPWTRSFWPIVIAAILAFAWLEWLRRRTVAEYPDAERTPMSNPFRRALTLRRLDRLGRLRASGALSEEEFQREKAALT